MARPLVIVNPRAAGGRAGRIFPEVRAVIENRLGPIDVAATEHPGHAIALAGEATRSGRALVVAVGGDGTLHEVANGVLDAGGGAAVGYVGQGTGGDFRRSLGLQHRLEAYVDALGRGREVRVDAGRARFRAAGEQRTRWFTNILSAGMGGLVDRYVAETTKAFGGGAAYFWSSARALATCKRGRLRCSVELAGRTEERAFDAYMVAICNGRYFGGGMHVAPGAKIDDGRFEIVVMDAPSKLAFAVFARRIYDGSHLEAPGVQCFSCDRVSVDLVNEDARSVFLLDVDGEPLGGLPLEVELVPKALRILA
jgi:YegS/Rv2252/BmrU family lipid kinase